MYNVKKKNLKTSTLFYFFNLVNYFRPEKEIKLKEIKRNSDKHPCPVV